MHFLFFSIAVQFMGIRSIFIKATQSAKIIHIFGHALTSPLSPFPCRPDPHWTFACEPRLLHSFCEFLLIESLLGAIFSISIVAVMSVAHPSFYHVCLCFFLRFLDSWISFNSAGPGWAGLRRAQLVNKSLPIFGRRKNDYCHTAHNLKFSGLIHKSGEEKILLYESRSGEET